MKLTIQTSNNLAPVEFEIQPEERLKDLKARIHQHFSVSPEEQKLTVGGHALTDNEDAPLEWLNECDDLEPDEQLIITLAVAPDFTMPNVTSNSNSSSSSHARDIPEPTTPFMLRCMASNQFGLAAKLLLGIGCLVAFALATTVSLAAAAWVGGSMMAAGAGMLFFNNNPAACCLNEEQKDTVALRK
jgi:hypothetical protein